MKRAAIYVRVSTQEQKKHGLSVDSQIVALREYCESHGYTVQDIYNDAGISARKSYKKRPALQAMIKACQRNELDLVLFTRLDRFFRSVPDYYACIEQMNDVPWRTIWEDYETETSDGVFKVNIMLAIAQAEADRTAEKIRSVKEYQRAQGYYVGGVAPLGYKVKGHDLIKNDEQSELVIAIFETYLKTYSVNSVLEMLREKGSNRSRNGVYNMLVNPTYMGDAYGYKCEPYITQEQYNEIKRMLGTTSKHRKEKTQNVYLFNGLLKCGCCGGNMLGTISTQMRGGERRKYKYYRCTNWQNRKCENANNISERKIEKQLIERAADECNNRSMASETSESDIKKAKAKISALESKLERVGQRFEDGDISRDEYRAKRDAIKNEIEMLKAQETPRSISIPPNWLDTYKDLNEAHKKIFWSKTLKSLIVNNGFVTIEF